MKTARLFCWILFIASLLFLRIRSGHANSAGKAYNIIKLELADAEGVKALLQRWRATGIGGSNLVDYARVDTWVDFFFIVGYAGVLWMVSRALARRQRRPWLKTLLRGCAALALVAGLLDVVENVLLLLNMDNRGGSFYSARYVAYPKFGLLALVLCVWLLALLANLRKGINRGNASAGLK